MISLLTLVLLANSVVSAQTSLKHGFEKSFLVGVAINRAQIYEEDQRGLKIIQSQFNSTTPENVLKWQLVHPLPRVYDLAAADRYVEFGERNHMAIIGHTLIWHKQTPKWVFQDQQGNPVSREVLLKRMEEHITTIVQRYRGRIKGWDVVNEALDEDGNFRRSPWLTIIGEDYVEKAFQYAHRADPDVELYYNDYALENEPKRNGAIALIKRLQSKGIPVHAVGLQGHDTLDWPTPAQQDATITAFERLGVKVNISELDVSVLPLPTQSELNDAGDRPAMQPGMNPYPDGLPESINDRLANRYGELFAVFLKHRRAIERVTFWGVTDADSWRNNWPYPGRTDYPLLFDRNGRPKAAFDAVIRSAESGTTGQHNHSDKDK